MNYQNLDATRVDQPQASTAPQILNGIFQLYRHSVGPSRANTTVMNEAEQYLQAPVIGDDSEILVLQLWKRIKPSYPSLASMAQDILTVPGMSVFPTLISETNLTSKWK